MVDTPIDWIVKHWSTGVNEMLLDPLFWQALGKALGWTFDGKFSRFSETMTFGEFEKRHWKTHAHQYFDLVLTGGNTEKFWKELLNK